MDPYEGINAYVFVADAHEPDFGRLRSLPRAEGPGVRAVGILNGPWDAIVAVSAGSLEELGRIVLEQIRGGQSPRTDTAVAIRPFRVIPMSPDLPPVVAFVRVRLQPGRGVEALDAAERIPGFVGAALVAGSFDLLLEFGGASVDDVAGVLTGDVSALPGVVSTETSFAAEVVQAG